MKTKENNIATKRCMHRSFLLLFSFLTICAFGQCQNIISNGMNMDSFIKAKQFEAIGKPLSPFKTTYKKRVFTNEDLKGKVVFINFWFAACPPCMAELPELNKLYDTLRSNKRFDFISFTFEKPKVIRKIIKKYNIHYKVCSLTADDCDRLILNSSFPNSMVIDPMGMIKLMKAGGSLDKKEIQAVIYNDYLPKILAELVAR